MRSEIRQAARADVGEVSAILLEAARWLEERGDRMWRNSELLPERIAEDVAGGLFFIAECSGEPAGTIKLQLADPLFWPDVPDHDDAAYAHRLAVRRKFAGCGASTALLGWAVEHALGLGRHYVRLDCEASRKRLRAVYERFGFRHHSDRQVGPYYVSRYEFACSADG